MRDHLGERLYWAVVIMTTVGASRRHPGQDFAFTELDEPESPLAEEAIKTLANFRSTVMAGLDPATQS